ncbi:MAG: hypothetical protein FWE67_15245 [Planctomycetaceae bacterium]|nr:hypothetical protein [Planctomycetaceae bacterium]
MAKDIVVCSDAAADVGGNAGGTSDFGGDLADDKGIDLNAEVQKEQDISDSTGSIKSVKGVFAGTMAMFAAAFTPLAPLDQQPNEGKPLDVPAGIGASIEEGDPAPDNRGIEEQVPRKPETEQLPPNKPPNYVGQTLEQVAEQTVEQQGYSIVSPETQDTDTYSNDKDEQ